MAWFSYQCKEHGEFRLSLPKRLPSYECPTCKASSAPVLRPGTTRTVEVLDNGLMARKVERLKDVEDIMRQRDAKHRPDDSHE